MNNLSDLSIKTSNGGETLIVCLLNKQLADTLDLRLQAKVGYGDIVMSPAWKDPGAG
jgi:hypothetical protein